ncbi:GNAT family N-acetyltransferase [Epilithonimonas sp.]|uniref:GNAT family N-acetyltransferase n=1 Tax=Epilithonimonas sp. TaxID=2894511 RepID=UPI0028974B00|nr:GNAT family N-acetyltransferase [Epilithonimonas sp.]
MEMNLEFRKAISHDSSAIWDILQDAITRRKNDGSKQWQDGYPNLETVKSDIEKGFGYVLLVGGIVVGYSALIFNDEPAYNDIEGEWLTNGDFLVVHRVAISDKFAGKGLSKNIFRFIEDVAKENNTFSIKVDTNFDNPAMLSILEKLGYQYCGEVHFRGSARKAFEKVL